MYGNKVLLASCIALTISVVGCKQQANDIEPTDAETASAVTQDEQATPIQPTQPAEAMAAGFDINTIPVSDKPIGEFPYVTLPVGYTSENYGKTNMDFARFPFWVNGQAVWVEGKFFGTAFAPDRDSGKSMSEFEVKKNFEGMVTAMGGVKLSEGKIPNDTIEGWGDEITMGFIDGLGDVYNDPVTTYLVRRTDGNIWVHLFTNTAGGSYIVGQEKGFEQTAKLLPASELKQQLDSAGKVALQVNFATDKTDILPDSLPQIDQVTELMKIDTALKLAVNGHTDNTGDPAHNQTLSEGRAQSVVKAIVDKGIDAARLSAKGFGDTQPVADNGTEQGKSQNRRVELVKQ